VVAFDTVDAMRVRDGKITDHCGVASRYSAVPQLGPKP
jgi:predicted SnoaL-like aldol condensation-catalyzing enzyme